MPVLDSLMEHKVLGREFKKGHAAGHDEGVVEGMEKGIEQGIEKGEAKILSMQLRKRFGAIPDWAEHEIQSAAPVQLEQWAQELLDAPSIEEVFRRQSDI